MTRRDEIRNITDGKVIPVECVAPQHRLVVMEMNVEMTRKPRPRIKQQKTKWWNLEKDEFYQKHKKYWRLLHQTKMNYEELEAD